MHSSNVSAAGENEMQKKPISAENIPAKRGQTNYPQPFAKRVAGRSKRKLGDFFGLKNFGINQTTLEPGAISALSHHHSKQDEFVYILRGELTLVLGDQEILMGTGDCIGLPAGNGIAHQLINQSEQETIYLEIGDRSIDDEVKYPNDDIKLQMTSNNSWIFTSK
jgi:uncharacterized cupin superfamily protein